MGDPIPVGKYLQETTADGSKITRTVGENGHPVISHEIFLKYAHARLRAAIELNNLHRQDLIKKFENKKTTPQQKEKLAHQIQDAETSARILIKLQENLAIFFDNAFEAEFQSAKLAKAAVQDDPLKLAEAEKRYQDAFDKVYNHNLQKIRQLNVLLAHSVDPTKDPSKVLKKINRQADLLRARESRPIQENHYQVLGLEVTNSHIPEGILTSTQKKLFQQVFGPVTPPDIHTNPSTIRDAAQVGQANAVRTEVKVGATSFVGHRHGSPSVLKIEDDAERQYRTLENVKQTMALAAKEKLAKMDPEHRARVLKGELPLPIDMATMSLLSPVAESIAGIDPDPMKQFRQVDDSRMAYWSMQGREVFIELPGMGEGGKPEHVRVVLNSSFMSVGVNAARGIGTLAAQHLVQRVNHRGLNHLIDSFMSASDELQGPNIKPIIRQIQQLERHPSIQHAQAKIDQFDRRRLHQAYAQLENYNVLLHETKTRLHQAKEEYVACQKALTDPEHMAMVDKQKLNERKKALQTEIKRLESTISKIDPERRKALSTISQEETKLDNLYKKLADARHKQFSPTELKELQQKLDFLQKQRGEALKTDIDFRKLRLFVDLLDTYYNQPQPGIKRTLQVHNLAKEKTNILKKFDKTLEPKEKEILLAKANEIQEKINALNRGNYRFQARFALLASHMDQFVEWFCKSGEDRTGLLDEHITAFCIFIEKHGHAPRWNNEEDSAKFHEIMPHVHNGAPNRETNGFNDDSPGLKVTDKDFEMKSVSYETDKKLANLVKNSGKIKGKENELLQKARKTFGVLVKAVSEKVADAKVFLQQTFSKKFTPAFDKDKSRLTESKPELKETHAEQRQSTRPKGQ